MTATDLGKYNKITGDERQKLRRKFHKGYEKGASIRDLAREHGRSYGFVHKLLEEEGTSMRPRGGRPSNAA